MTDLDLQHKQYARTSMGIAYDDGLAEIRALGNKVGSTLTIAIEHSAHGARTIDGVATEEFANVRTQSVASPGLSVTTRSSRTHDFLPASLPVLSCIERAGAWPSRYGTPQQYAPELQAFFTDRFKKMAGPRDQKITESGPRQPDRRIPPYAVGAHEQRQTSVAVRMRNFEIESGNVRAIQSDDPAFEVPADFAKMVQSRPSRSLTVRAARPRRWGKTSPGRDAFVRMVTIANSTLERQRSHVMGVRPAFQARSDW